MKKILRTQDDKTVALPFFNLYKLKLQVMSDPRVRCLVSDKTSLEIHFKSGKRVRYELIEDTKETFLLRELSVYEFEELLNLYCEEGECVPFYELLN